MKALLTTLFEGRTLDADESARAVQEIADGVHAPAQVAAFLAALCMRPLTIAELAGFQRGIFERAVRVDLSEFEPVDVCGTGGDGKDTFNVSTAAAFVVAGAGVRVAKHGNHGVSSACGSSTVLEQLGVGFSADPGLLKRRIEKAGICFLHAPLFHPALKQVAAIRKELGVRTFFNLLGPLLNPAAPVFQLIGVPNLETARLFGYLSQQRGSRWWIVHGLDGHDEISLTGPAKVIAGERERVYEPRSFGLSPADPAAIRAGANAAENAEILKKVLEGRGTAAQQDVVIANAALALCGALQLTDPLEGAARARESIASGRAAGALRQLIEIQ